MKNFLILFLLIFLYSCQSPQVQESNNSEPYTSFEIDNAQTNIINGPKGGVFILPKECFVDETGTPVNETIELQIIEAYTIEDIFNNNLETNSEDGLLVSGGMVNIEASTASGAAVQIASGKSITYQKPFSNQDTNQYQFFSQSEDKLWENPQPPNPFLTYLPLEEHSKKYIFIKRDEDGLWTYADAEISESKSTKEGFELFDSSSFMLMISSKSAAHLFNDLKVPLDESFLQKTYIASKEYEERFSRFLPWGEEYFDMHRIYLENVDKPLWIVDSMVLEKYSAKLIKAETDSPDTDYFKQLQKDVKTLIAFKNQYKTTFPEDKYSDEIREALNFALKKIAANNIIQSFSIRKNGWHNIDYYFDSKTLSPIELTIKCNTAAERVSLILKNDKAIRNGIESSANTYCLDREKSCRIMLPQNTKAYLIASSTKDGKILFAKKEIQIGQNEVEELELNPSSTDEIKKELQAIENGY